MAKAYILITTRAGEIDVVREKLSHHEYITCADPIIGPYDIIALVETEDYTQIGTVVLRFVHELSGVEKTTTCMVIEAPAEANGTA